MPPPSRDGLVLGLYRHGPAGKADAKAYPDDDDRPLTAKGRKLVKGCARGLAAMGFKPARIFTSPALRCRETAEIMRKAFRLKPSALRRTRFLHHETPARRGLKSLLDAKPRGHILWVGHEPWLGDCLSILLSGRRLGRSLGLRKGGFAAITLEEPASRAALLAFIPPETLATLG